jgi:NMD protein affecting ribosome stability and mRNA decay
MNVKGSKKRNDKLIQDKRKDVYLKTNSQKTHMVCSNCGAIFSNGRWTWKELINNLKETTCPACKRISDNYPAGFVEIKGSFYSGHEKEISNLILNTEKMEKKERPLERIMMFKPGKSKATLTTTGIHIARRIGEALSRSYQGNFSFQYLDGEKSIRVFWERQ